MGNVSAVAFVMTLVALVKRLTAQDWRAVVTQLVAWAGGIAVTFLFAGSAFAASNESLG